MTGGILYDADFVIALFVPHESTHAPATKRYAAFGAHSPFILRPVIYEVATVLSRKFGHELAHPIVHDLLDNRFTILNVTDIEAEGWRLYFSHRRKDISFFDCANLAAAHRHNLKIASFDKFYPKAMLAA